MTRLLKQVIKFVVVGSVAFCFDFGLYTALTRLVDGLQDYYVLVSVGTSAVAVTVAYFLNHYWTFRQHEHASWRLAVRYFAVTGSGLVWQNVLLASLVEIVGVYDLYAKVIAVLVVGLCWNFALSRWWVFCGATYSKVAESNNK